MSDGERAARVKAVQAFYGLKAMWGPGLYDEAAREAARIAGVARATLYRHEAWALADRTPATAKIRAVAESLPGRRSNPRGADPR